MALENKAQKLKREAFAALPRIVQATQEVGVSVTHFAHKI